MRGAVGVKYTLDFKSWGQKHMQHTVLTIFILITCCNDNALDILGYIKCIVTFNFSCFFFTYLTWLLENLTFKMWLVLYCSWAKRQPHTCVPPWKGTGVTSEVIHLNQQCPPLLRFDAWICPEPVLKTTGRHTPRRYPRKAVPKAFWVVSRLHATVT